MKSFYKTKFKKSKYFDVSAKFLLSFPLELDFSIMSNNEVRGTKAEFSGIPGDIIIGKMVRQFKPNLLISAHIHEGEGIEDKIGKTRVVQVRRRGKILEI